MLAAVGRVLQDLLGMQGRDYASTEKNKIPQSP